VSPVGLVVVVHALAQVALGAQQPHASHPGKVGEHGAEHGLVAEVAAVGDQGVAEEVHRVVHAAGQVPFIRGYRSINVDRRLELRTTSIEV
jgi:hypothetical protein